MWNYSTTKKTSANPVEIGLRWLPKICGVMSPCSQVRLLFVCWQLKDYCCKVLFCYLKIFCCTIHNFSSISDVLRALPLEYYDVIYQRPLIASAPCIIQGSQFKARSFECCFFYKAKIIFQKKLVP